MPRLARRVLANAHPDRLAERLAEALQRREERRLLAVARGGRDVCWVDEDPEPLVTVRITTYKRAELLVDLALPSVLAQTYGRLEVLVVGDGTDAATDRAMAAVRDPRVRYVNLPRYPTSASTAHQRWATSGLRPANTALSLC